MRAGRWTVLSSAWYPATTAITPTIASFNPSRSSAGIQYSRIVLPPTCWTS